MVAAAIIGGAVVGAVGSSVAGSEASSATESAANTAAGVQYAGLQQQAQLAAPYTALGQAAIPTYESLLGIGGGAGGAASGGPNAQQIQQTLANMPGYQFQLNQGLQSTKNAASASGMALSGNTLQALDQYSQGLASSNYQQYLGDVQGAVGLGQAAAAGQAANIGTASTNLSNIAVNQGNTLAGIDANTVAGISGAATNASNQYMTNQTLQSIYGQGGGGGNANTGAGVGF